MTAYYCGARHECVEGHQPDDCVFCLRKNLDYWKSMAEATGHAGHLRDLNERVRRQRIELARLNKERDLYLRIAIRLLPNGKRIVDVMPNESDVKDK